MRFWHPPPRPVLHWIPYATWIDRYGECALPVLHLRMALFALLMMGAALWGLYGWSQNWGDPDVYRAVFGRPIGSRSSLIFGPFGLPIILLLLSFMLLVFRLRAQTRF